MATISKDLMSATTQLTGSSPATITVLEAATQTFVKGELVYIEATGYLTEIGGDTPAVIYGMAAENAHNDASAGTHEISVYLGLPTQLFAANALEASLVDHVLAQTDIGTPMAIQRDTTLSKTFLNVTTFAGANVRVFTHKVARGTAIGDTNGRLLFNFLPNFVQNLGTS